MINSLKSNILITLAITVTLLLSVLVGGVSAQVSDANKSAACQGLGLQADPGGGCVSSDATPAATIESIIADVINILSVIVGVVAVIMVIFGGFRYVTSAGDSNKVSSAKNTIVFALVGLVIAVFAQVIVQFVLKEATSPPPPEASIITTLAITSL